MGSELRVTREANPFISNHARSFIVGWNPPRVSWAHAGNAWGVTVDLAQV